MKPQETLEHSNVTIKDIKFSSRNFYETKGFIMSSCQTWEICRDIDCLSVRVQAVTILPGKESETIQVSRKKKRETTACISDNSKRDDQDP